ncbi:hypothetical protein ACI2L1_05340 [Streptomyces sp. NPDC019531]|uniref:hypothetical protein n=1 Tax=Streptomyces sp. NPDC019531 TaxID=3365062 RepID=UPI00384EF5EB
MSCPATAGHVQCPLNASSLGRDPRLPLADPKPSPTEPVKIRIRRLITIPPETGAQHHQALAHGSPDWRRVYFRLRNSAEDFNGFSKDPTYEAIKQPGTRRIRGMAAQTILLAFQLAHANRRKIDRRLSPPSRPTVIHPADVPLAADRPDHSAAGPPQPASPPSERYLTQTGKSHSRQPYRAPQVPWPTSHAPAPPIPPPPTTPKRNGPHRDHDADRSVTAQKRLTSVLRGGGEPTEFAGQGSDPRSWPTGEESPGPFTTVP